MLPVPPKETPLQMGKLRIQMGPLRLPRPSRPRVVSALWEAAVFSEGGQAPRGKGCYVGLGWGVRKQAPGFPQLCSLVGFQMTPFDTHFPGIKMHLLWPRPPPPGQAREEPSSQSRKPGRAPGGGDSGLPAVATPPEREGAGACPRDCLPPDR